MARTRTSSVTAEAVGAELRRVRQGSDLTLSDVAQRLDVDKSYVANVEAGRRNLTLGQLTWIADALDAQLNITLNVPHRTQVTLPE